MKNKHLRIEVTARDIRLGQPKQGTSCPIARAMNRVVPSWSKPTIFVEHNNIQFSVLTDDEANWYIAEVGPKMEKFIERFDAGLPVKPFVARLRFEPEWY